MVGTQELRLLQFNEFTHDRVGIPMMWSVGEEIGLVILVHKETHENHNKDLEGQRDRVELGDSSTNQEEVDEFQDEVERHNGERVEPIKHTEDVVDFFLETRVVSGAVVVVGDRGVE